MSRKSFAKNWDPGETRQAKVELDITVVPEYSSLVMVQRQLERMTKSLGGRVQSITEVQNDDD